MADFPFVEWLARRYQSQGSRSNSWSDYLKAHGLANYGIARDPREERYRLVYEIEESSYEGKHPLTYSEHRHLTERHKHLLKDYRDRVREDFDTLDEGEKLLSSDDIFSQSNINLLLNFSNKVFGISKKCSKGFIDVSREIIVSCVEVLGKLGWSAPCEFAVIALGSVAKGEATPYSDLEYAFIVESEDRYFTKLAVDSYFRIGNLGESPLDSFDIAELKDTNNAITELPTVGFRIDGIKHKAGNIPTGRVGGQRLILSVKGFMDLFKTSAESPFDGVAGDKSDMLSTSALIHSSQGLSCPLYESLCQAMEKYNANAPKDNILVNRKRLLSFAHNIENYSYLPDQLKTGTAAEVETKVKVHIFRYPTLLANNLRVCLCLNFRFPWDTLEFLVSSGLLAEENHSYLKIVLALSIYICTKAYLMTKSQKETISFYSSSNDRVLDMYHVPNRLFIILGCILIPIKRSIQITLHRCFHSVNNGVELAQLVSYLVGNILVDRVDFMIKFELLFFIDDCTNALHELSLSLDMSIDDVRCERVREVIHEKYQWMKSNDLDAFMHKSLQRCGIAFERNEKYACAIDFYSWLATYHKDVEKIAHFKVLIANCMFELKRPKVARTLLNQAIILYKQALKLEPHQDLVQYMQFQMINNSCGFRKNSLVYQEVANSYSRLGTAFEEEGYPRDGIQPLNYSLSIYSLLLSVMLTVQASTSFVLGIESILEYVRTVGIRALSTNIRRCLCDMAVAHTSLSSVHCILRNMAESLEHSTKSLDIYRYLFGANTIHSNLVTTLDNMATIYDRMGDYAKSLEYRYKQLSMQLALDGEDCNSPVLAECYSSIGQLLHKIGDCMSALAYHRKALNMRQALYGATTIHKDIKKCYYNIANVQFTLGNYRSALDSHAIYAEMQQAVCRGTVNQSVLSLSYISSGSDHDRKGEYSAALEYYNKALEIELVRCDENPNDCNIAMLFNDIGKVYTNIGNFPTALDYCSKARRALPSINGEITNQLNLAQVLRTIARVHSEMRDYKSSLKYHIKSLEMLELLPTDLIVKHKLTEQYIDVASLFITVGQLKHASYYITQALIIAVNNDDTLSLCITLCCISDILIDSSSHQFALQYLKIADLKSSLIVKLEREPYIVDLLSSMSNCYIRRHCWRKAWLHLHLALNASQYRTIQLAQVHMSIGRLLLHLGHVSQSLEHALLALDITSDLLAKEAATIPKYTKLNAEASSLTGSLHLIKICQDKFRYV